MKEIGPPKEGERWFVMLPFPKDATERFVERVENGASK